MGQQGFGWYPKLRCKHFPALHTVNPLPPPPRTVACGCLVPAIGINCYQSDIIDGAFR